MKRVIATAILLCQIAIAFGQQCVISARKENIVYIGVPNPIDIAVEGRFCRDFTVSTKNGTVEKQKVACNYAWSPAISGTTEICVKEQKSGKVIGKAIFRVKELPLPVVKLAGKSGGEISRAVLKVQVALSVTLEDFDFDARFVVGHYRVTIFRGNKLIFTEAETEIRFPSSILNAYETTETNDRVIFSEIMAKTPVGKEISLHPIEFTIN